MAILKSNFPEFTLNKMYKHSFNNLLQVMLRSLISMMLGRCKSLHDKNDLQYLDLLYLVDRFDNNVGLLPSVQLKQTRMLISIVSHDVIILLCLWIFVGEGLQLITSCVRYLQTSAKKFEQNLFTS